MNHSNIQKFNKYGKPLATEVPDIADFFLTTSRNGSKIQNLVQDNRFSCRDAISWFSKHEI